MAISKDTQLNIDNSNLTAYPNGQVKDDSGAGDGFPLIRVTMSDIFETFDKLMRLAALTFNGNFDNEINGFQFVNALIALAGKNDYIMALTTSSGILQIATNTAILNLNERIIVQAATNWTSETQIKGTGASLLIVNITRQYKAGDYLMLIKTSGGVQLVCLATADNLGVMVSELAYLKAAANSDEDTGTSVTKATTPASNLYIFGKRVNDNTVSIPFLASHVKNGLLSAADKIALDRLNTVKNIGWINNIDPGGGTIGSFYARSGDVTTAQVTATYGPFYNVSGTDVGSGTVILVTMANAMADINYFVRPSVESIGTLSVDSTAWNPVFKIISTTQFSIVIREGAGGTQNIKLHLEVVQLS